MNAEVRTILAGELHQLASDLALQAPGLREGSEEAATQCLGLCERLGQVADMIEAPALQEVAVFLMSNIPALLGSDAHAQAPAELCADLELCLIEGIESERWSAIAGTLSDARWPASMESDVAAEVAQGLKPLAAAEAPQPPAPPPTVEMSDLTLRSSEEVGSATLQAFFHEAPQQAAQLSQLFARWRGEIDPAQLASGQRLTHTLKGSSALCGLHAIAHLADAMESVLQGLAGGSQQLSTAAQAQLVEAGDTVEQLIELAASGGEAPPKLAELINSLHAGASAASDTTALAEPETLEQPEVTPAAPAEAPPADADAWQPTLHVPTALIDENLRRAGEMSISIGQLNSQVGGTLERANRLLQQLALVQSQVYELETLVDTRGVPALRLQQRGAGDGGFDPLELDEYTALHSLSRAFAESTLDSRELSRELSDELLKLQNLLSQHARLGRELTDSVMNTRLVPVSSIVPRLERIVRQTARQTGHEVELTIVGRELCIDTDILNGLVEPLMHALRNAVDHGIETPAQREALGKPASGSIRLSFRREGNRIEVTCADDGRGLDYAAIVRRARQRGLLSADRDYSPAELSPLIFTPGFSTRDAVTAVSGRGVGMDVVRTSVERLKGSVHLDSREGAGCTLLFRLPLSLTSAHVLFVSVGSSIYGLPSTAVDQILYSDAGRVMQLGDRHAFAYGGQVSPLYSLGELLGHDGGSLAEIDTRPRPLVIVNGDTGQVALAVDRALDSRQIVIKGLSAMLPTLPGIAGACVLPDGGIGLILEVRELLRHPASAVAAPSAPSEAPAPRTARHVLIVDDSLSARRALAQLLSDCGYEVTTAVDGLEAIAKLEQRRPDILLLDLEMPRMNGLELTAHLRSKPQWSSLPILMITSRSAEKHRSQARRAGVTEYLTKPYLEHELLDRLEQLESAAVHS